MSHYREWVSGELAPWRWRGLTRATISAAIDEAVPNQQTLFRFDVIDQKVICVPKAKHFLGEHVSEDFSNIVLNRAFLYRDLMQRALSGCSIDGDFSLAVDINDFPPLGLDFPIFSFQKPLGARPILLPDVDLVGADYFSSLEFQDRQRFASKRDAAIFVGSTSGALITMETVENLSLPRLRSAVYFKGAEDVDFRLPLIVQCDSPETEAAVRALDVGGATMSWPDQFGFKYIISVDGNGATCSRVAITLKSNSVLFKYDSKHQLFYFRGLQPWKHYVPVGDDADLEGLLANGAAHPEQFEQITLEGQKFFAEHLTRARVEQYVSELLTGYVEILDDGRTTSPGLAIARANGAQIGGVIHVQDIGDVVAKPGGWASDPRGDRSIEGFRLIAPESIPDLQLQYSGFNLKGDITSTAMTGEFCGSTGQFTPLYGFSVTLISSHGRDLTVSYQGLYKSGRMTAFFSDGESCLSDDGTPLKSFKILLKERSSSEI